MDALKIALIFIITILFGLSYLSQYKFSYWKMKKVPYLRPVPLLGNYGGYITLKEFLGTMVHKLCQQFPNAPYIGAFYGTEPTLIVKDPELIKLVMAKDFYYFHGREVTKYSNRESTTQNIFFNGGDAWKVVRQNMTPLFSSAKLKNMFYLVEQSAKQLETLLDEMVKKNGGAIDARILAARFTMSSVGSTIFGVDTRTLEEPVVNNPFTKIGNSLFSTSRVRGLKWVARGVWPAIFYTAGFQVFPISIDNFFNGLVKDVFKGRGYKPSGRNDFIDLLLNFKNQKFLIGESISNLKTGGNETVQVELTDDLLVSQCGTMFAAAFETSSTTLGFTLFEIAKNPAAQKRVHAELDAFLQRHENRITYDCKTEMPFLEACVDEALRLYPVLSVLKREVIEDYTFPTGLRVDKGVRIHIPVWHIHRQPNFFPDPELYKPERFLPENRQNIKPYTYFPFGEGPRICLGKRFGKMQVLAGLMTFLKKYRVELAEDMPDAIVFEPINFLTQSKHGVRLRFTPRDSSDIIGMRFSKMQVIPGLITFLKKYHVDLAPGTSRELRLATTTLLLQPGDPLNLKLTPRAGWEENVYAN